MIKECPKCGANVSPKAQVCPECGEPLIAPPTLEKSRIKSKSGNTTASRQRYIPKLPKKNGRCLKTILIVFGVFIVIGAIANLGGKENKPTKNNFDTTNAPVTNNVATDTMAATSPISNNNSQSTQPIETVPVSAVDIFYLDLYNNYENYMNQYVTISGPISYARDDKGFNIKEGIDGFTGMITVDLSASYQTEEGKYVTVTGRIDNKALGYLYLKDAVVKDYGDGAKNTYDSQKAAYNEAEERKAQEEQEAKKAEIAQFITECQTYNYDDLRRNPDNYSGAKIKVQVKIQQEMEGGLFDNGDYYRCSENDDLNMWLGNEYIVEYSEAYTSSNLLKDDIVTIYGEFNGITEVTRALTGTKDKVPSIKAVSIELNTTDTESDIENSNAVAAAVSDTMPVESPETTPVTESSDEEQISNEFKSALNKATSYSDMMHMSKAGVYYQLTSEYGEKFSAEAAQYAVDNVKVDWKTNALEKAKDYSDTMHMSKLGVYNQLTSEYGEQFTPEEAQYAVDNVETDWGANALEKASEYQESMNMSPDAIREQLISEYGEQFTAEEADYAISHLN